MYIHFVFKTRLTSVPTQTSMTTISTVYSSSAYFHLCCING